MSPADTAHEERTPSSVVSSSRSVVTLREHERFYDEAEVDALVLQFAKQSFDATPTSEGTLSHLFHHAFG